MIKQHTVPIQKQTINIATGVSKSETVNGTLIPPAPDKCQECGTKHEKVLPHNKDSLFYQMSFFGREGRWPTWTDAMSHCSPHIRDRWTAVLKSKGVSVDEDVKK